MNCRSRIPSLPPLPDARAVLVGFMKHLYCIISYPWGQAFFLFFLWLITWLFNARTSNASNCWSCRKYRALRLDSGNYAWGSENVTKKAIQFGFGALPDRIKKDFNLLTFFGYLFKTSNVFWEVFERLRLEMVRFKCQHGMVSTTLHDISGMSWVLTQAESRLARSGSWMWFTIPPATSWFATWIKIWWLSLRGSYRLCKPVNICIPHGRRFEFEILQEGEWARNFLTPCTRFVGLKTSSRP